MHETEATTQIRAVSEPRVEPPPVPSTTEYHDDTIVPKMQHSKIVQPRHKYETIHKTSNGKIAKQQISHRSHVH